MGRALNLVGLPQKSCNNNLATLLYPALYCNNRFIVTSPYAYFSLREEKTITKKLSRAGTPTSYRHHHRACKARRKTKRKKIIKTVTALALALAAVLAQTVVTWAMATWGHVIPAHTIPFTLVGSAPPYLISFLYPVITCSLVSWFLGRPPQKHAKHVPGGHIHLSHLFIMDPSNSHGSRGQSGKDRNFERGGGSNGGGPSSVSPPLQNGKPIPNGQDSDGWTTVTNPRRQNRGVVPGGLNPKPLDLANEQFRRVFANTSNR